MLGVLCIVLGDYHDHDPVYVIDTCFDLQDG